MSNVELNWKETLAVGKIGRTGVETHAITCEIAVKNEGMPWQSTEVRKAHTLCQSGRIGYRTPHSMRFNVPVNSETVTCEHCRSFGCVPAVESK